MKDQETVRAAYGLAMINTKMVNAESGMRILACIAVFPALKAVFPALKTRINYDCNFPCMMFHGCCARFFRCNISELARADH